jgi:methylated-DNA-[protein]-cysteine S-methyltransferase
VSVEANIEYSLHEPLRGRDEVREFAPRSRAAFPDLGPSASSRGRSGRAMAWIDYESPFGRLTLVGGDRGLREVHFPGRSPALDPAERDPEPLREACRQLAEYFAGRRRTFALALDLAGSPFRQRVWRALLELPYGQVTTYGELARELGVRDGDPGARVVTAAQKVGWAIGATPAPIVVPCHRVVAADGALTGYRGGLRRKQALLDFEAGRAGAWAHQGQLALGVTISAK